MAEVKPEEAAKQGEQGEGEEKPKKKGLPILWIIIGLLVVLLIGGAAYFLKFMKGPEKTAQGKGKPPADEQKEEHAEEEPAEEEHAEEAHEEEDHVEEDDHGGGKVKCPEEAAAGGHGGGEKESGKRYI